MKADTLKRLAGAIAGFLLAPVAWAFTSGSTGADGALTPSVDTEVVLPPGGVLNYTTVNIPEGITVRFKSDQINLLSDAEGQVLEGDPQTAVEVIDLWTFERDTASQDPNWTLVETRTPT